MSGHEVMVQRITAIIAELYQYGFVSCKKMMDEFNISERTLYRDLNRLGDRIVPDGDGIYRLAPAYAKPQALKRTTKSRPCLLWRSAPRYLLRGRERDVALRSFAIGSVFGTLAIIGTLQLGDSSAYEVAQVQPVKLAAMEGEWQTEPAPAPFHVVASAGTGSRA